MGSRSMPGMTLLGLLLVGMQLGAPAAAAASGLALSGGAFDVDHGARVAEAGFDYAFAPVRLGLVPQAGLGLTGDDAWFVHGGARYDIALARRYSLVLSLAVALYEEGDGKDLGLLVEFRSGVDLLFRLHSGARIGFGIYHLSNAGLSGHNPGANSLLLRYRLAPGGRSD